MKRASGQTVRTQRKHKPTPLNTDVSGTFGIPVWHDGDQSAGAGSPSGTGSSQEATATTGAMVVRFHTAASRRGVGQLSGSGLKVASLSDYKTEGIQAALLEQPDVLYFDRFDIAIVREKEIGKARAAMAATNVASQRLERIYLASSGTPKRSEEMSLALSRDYLEGFRAGVNLVIDRLLDHDSDPMTAATAFADGPAFTWGLQATRVDKTRLIGSGIRIAILDTGYDDTHPDFLGRGIIAKSFVVGEEYRDGNGHGTHTLGTIFGPASNAGSQPRFGVAYGAELYVGKVLNDRGRGTDSSIIAGMQWALDQGCSVISMSLGAPVTAGDAFSDAYEHIGQVCLDTNCLVIAAAGNNSARPGVIAPVNSPANCPSVLAVAAIGPDLNVASFSAGAVNPSQGVDLCAPGIEVLSTWLGGAYHRLNGTSMATPHVAAIAALLAEQDTKNRGRVLWEKLTQSCLELPLPATYIGSGLIQAP